MIIFIIPRMYPWLYSDCDISSWMCMYCLKLYLLYLIIIVLRATGKISLLLLTVLPSWNKVITYLLTYLGNDHLTLRGGGYGFFLKKIFRLPMLLKKIFWFWWRKQNLVRDRLFRSEIFFQTTRVRIFIFFWRAKRNFFFQNSTLAYMAKTLNQIIFFPPPKSEYFFQQHW
jgi:hypothetical protein